MNSMTDTHRALIAAISAMALAIVFMVATALAEEPETDLDTLIAQRIGQFSIEVYPHNDTCRRIVHLLDETMYMVCRVGNDLVVHPLRGPDHEQPR